MSRLFVVKKPCVIERRYYDGGAIYSPSNRMSDIALKVLIGNGFLEEKTLVKDNKRLALESIKNARAKCAHLQYHIEDLVETLKEAYKNLEEM